MAHESFESQDVADILNAGFVSVKVDREERPDIDEVYMSVCQAMTGSGGWPLTILMTADKKPFFAGTYFPKGSEFGRMGLTELIEKIIGIWSKDRESLIQNSQKIFELFKDTGDGARHEAADQKAILEKAFDDIKGSFDAQYGGFSYSPKFPAPHYLLYLLHYWKAYGDPKTLDMVETTLEHMYRGGIFDHVGYGFSRYSTDHQWLVPHFEKMLYDNAMLLLAYTECFAATGKQKYQDIGKKIATYVLRDMRSPDGGFYSAEDADSEGVEGKYYVWDYSELENLLSGDELRLLEERYGVTRRGNFEGKNILNLTGEDTGDMDAVFKKLYDVRLKRIPPFKDTKISASWNGLMIEALARAGAVMGEPAYIESAKKAADFVLSEMIGEKGGLSGSYKDGRRSEKGFLGDYANMINALTALYSVALDIRYLQEAARLAEDMIQIFWDEDEDRFYMCKKEEEELFFRPRDEYDGAMPSGNASAITALLRLCNLTGHAQFCETVDRAMNVFSVKANASPGSYVHFLTSLLVRLIPHRQVMISAERVDKAAVDTYATIARRFLPFTTVIYYDRSSQTDESFPKLSGDKTTEPFAGYVCENFSCQNPVYSREDLLLALEE